MSTVEGMGMHAASHGGRRILRHIARIAMIERGLQPDFPPAARRRLTDSPSRGCRMRRRTNYTPSAMSMAR